MNAGRLALRLLRREYRAGELRVLLLAVMIAVASVTTVSFFADRVRQSLDRQANQLLGADLAIVSDHPLPPAFSAEAAQRHLDMAQTLVFPSMVLHGAHNQLAEIKAVSAAYPLRGQLRVSDHIYGQVRQPRAVPQPGTVWLEARLLQQLALKPGDAVGVGNVQFRVAEVLTQEPDRGGDFFSIAPRLMMNLDDLASTGLIQPASLVHYRLLLAGDAQQVDIFRRWAEQHIGRGERLEGVRDARPEIRVALERAQKYLGLAALVSVVLAAVAVALAARRFMQRHLDSCAMMRCLGASQLLVFRLYLYQFIWLGVLAGLFGSLAGYAAQSVLAYWLGAMAGGELAQPTLLPLAEGVFAGLLLLLAFSLPPLLRLRQTPPLRVLRRELGVPEPFGMAAYVAGSAVVAGLLLWKAGDLVLGLYVVAGLAGALLFAAALTWVMVRTITKLPGQAAWLYGLKNLQRRSVNSVLQIAAFGLGMMALLLLTMVRGDLLQSWKNTLPPDAPNRFIINIQPDQRTPLRDFFAHNKLSAPEMFPMVRGRLVALNGKAVSAADYADDRAKRLVEREFNLSWASRLQSDNRIVAGRWWPPAGTDHALWSVEQGIAQTLGIRLGDTLTYEVAGMRVPARVASLRKVEWDSLHANFFVLAPPGLLDNYPASYITSFYLPDDQSEMLSGIVQAFPNFTIIDVAAIMAQVRAIMDRVASAVEFVFVFTVLAGLMVLYAAIAASQDERIFEAAILRTLGARRRQLLAVQFAEFGGIGVLAGLVAAAGASGVGYVLSTKILNVPFVLNPWLWLVSVAMGGLGITVAGYIGTRKVLRQPPLQTLRGLP